MNIILKIKEILNSNDTKKKIGVVVSLILISISSIAFIFNLLFNGSIIVGIFLGVFDSSFILFLLIILNCKKNMTNRNIRGFPITKDNIIYAKLLICLVSSVFITFGIIGLLGNYKYLKTEAKITSINQENKMIQGDNSIQSTYQIEYTIDNKHYQEVISEPSDSSIPLKIGDTKTVIIRTNILKQNYKYVDGDYQTLSEQSKGGYTLFTFLTCFSIFICCGLLYGFDKSIQE